MKKTETISRLYLFTVAVGFLSLFTFHNASFGASSSPLIRKLDSNYYYLQHQGIKSLKFNIHWAQLDPFSESDDKKLLNNPTVQFKWKAGQDKPDFELDESARDVSPIRELEIIKFITRYSEALLPVPLSQTLEDYSLKGKKKRRGFIEARFTTDTPHQVMQYDFKIDPKRWVIHTLHTMQQSSPLSVVNHLKYADRGGQWQVLESRALFEVNEKKYEEITEFFYNQIEGYWLPTRIKQQLKEGTKLAQSYIFTITGHKIN